MPSIICFVGGDPDGWPIIGLYTIPIGVIVILTCICVLLIVWRIYKVSSSRNGNGCSFMALI